MVSRTIKAALGLLALGLLSLLLMALLVPPRQAKPVVAPKSVLNLIKINQYYVLYTCPITPRLDRSGTFIVGAEAIAQMLNAKFTQNPQGTAVTMIKNGQAVQFTVGSQTALVNGKLVALPVIAQLDPPTRQMLIPLSILTKAFGIPSTWNQARHTLNLTGKTLMNNLTPPDLLSNVYAEFIGPDTHSLVPMAVTLLTPVAHQDIGQLNLTVQNISRRTIPKDRNYVNLLIAAKYPAPNGPIVLYGVGGAAVQGETATPNPPLKPGATRGAGGVLTFPPTNAGYTLYVAVWPVVSRRR